MCLPVVDDSPTRCQAPLLCLLRSQQKPDWDAAPSCSYCSSACNGGAVLVSPDAKILEFPPAPVPDWNSRRQIRANEIIEIDEEDQLCIWGVSFREFRCPLYSYEKAGRVCRLWLALASCSFSAKVITIWIRSWLSISVHQAGDCSCTGLLKNCCIHFLVESARRCRYLRKMLLMQTEMPPSCSATFLPRNVFCHLCRTSYNSKAE